MKISIITATMNSADTLDDCLTSVAQQSYPASEHIVIDGSSSDGTLAVLKRHHAKIAALVSEPDRGIYDALNKGLARATGEVVGFLHADDVYADTEVLARIAAAFADPQVDAVYGDLVYVAKEDTNRVVRHWRAGAYRRERLAWGWMPPHPTLYMRRSAYARYGGFDLRYRIAADYDFMLRVLSRMTGSVVYLPELLVRMRVGGTSNRSFRQLLRKSAEDYRALRANRFGGIGALAWKNISKIPQFLPSAYPDNLPDRAPFPSSHRQRHTVNETALATAPPLSKASHPPRG
jgi:glycosyltransferase involved in cell wall biosynthesis